MKTLILLVLLGLALTFGSAHAADVIVKENKEFRIWISMATVPNKAVATKKIRNYMAYRGYIVDEITLVQSGSGTTPWIVDVNCFFNVDDFRGIPVGQVQERFKDRNDIDDVILDN